MDPFTSLQALLSSPQADQLLAQIGWHGTAADFRSELEKDYSEDLCQWAYGLGNSQRQELEATASEVETKLDQKVREWKQNHPNEAAQYGEKMERYAECFLQGFRGDEVSGEGSSNWWWWLLALAGVGGLGYWYSQER